MPVCPGSQAAGNVCAAENRLIGNQSPAEVSVSATLQEPAGKALASQCHPTVRNA